METVTNCPVCDGSEHIPYISMKPDFTYHLCKCGAAFLSPRMDDDELRTYYTSGAYRENTAERDANNDVALEEQAERGAYVAPMIQTQIRSVLDIGASSGALLRAIKGRFPACECAGMDIDPVITYDDMPIYRNFEEIESRFDLITCMQTLEHMRQPKKVVNWMYDHLNPGGAVMIEVPNRRAWMAAYMPPHHVVAFDEKSLRSMFIGYRNIVTKLHGDPKKSPLDLNILLVANRL